MFTITEDSDWVRNIEAYAFVYDDVYLDSDVPGEGAESQTYYKLKFGIRTGTMLDMLEDIYDLEPFPEESDDEETEEGTEEGTEDGSEDVGTEE